MAPLEISVTGSSSISRHLERAVLSLHASCEGPLQTTVANEATVTSNSLRQMLKDLAPKTASGEPTPDAPVTVFSVGGLRSWSETPRDKNNNPGAPVYYAQVNLEATFRDFTKLGEVTGKLLGESNIEISGIDWRLADETRNSLGSESRKLAMLNAMEIARDYSEVIGREVTAVEVNDGFSRRGVARMALAGSAPGPQILDLTPQKIELSHEVGVKFRGE